MFKEILALFCLPYTCNGVTLLKFTHNIKLCLFLVVYRTPALASWQSACGLFWTNTNMRHFSQATPTQPLTILSVIHVYYFVLVLSFNRSRVSASWPSACGIFWTNTITQHFYRVKPTQPLTIWSVIHHVVLFLTQLSWVCAIAVC